MLFFSLSLTLPTSQTLSLSLMHTHTHSLSFGERETFFTFSPRAVKHIYGPPSFSLLSQTQTVFIDRFVASLGIISLSVPLSSVFFLTRNTSSYHLNTLLQSLLFYSFLIFSLFSLSVSRYLLSLSSLYVLPICHCSLSFLYLFFALTPIFLTLHLKNYYNSILCQHPSLSLFHLFPYSVKLLNTLF